MVLRTCDICDRKFKKTEHFKRHERSHTKERPYECSACHKRFSRSDVLSRHAKSHTKTATNNAAGDIVHGTNPNPSSNGLYDSKDARRLSNATLPSSMVAPNEDVQRTLPTPSLEIPSRRLPTIPPNPRSAALGPSSLATSNLNFLADISAHHARTEAEMNQMTIDEPQPYFGWNDVSTLHDQEPNHQHERHPAFDAIPSDMLQIWLEPRAESSSIHGSVDLMREATMGFIGDAFMYVDRRQGRSDLRSGDIPAERFARVERCWLAPPNNVGRLMSTLWGEVARSDTDNLFTIPNYHAVSPAADNYPGSRFGLDEECRNQLQTAFGLTPAVLFNLNTSPLRDTLSPVSSTVRSGSALNFPPAEILDMSLDLYFRDFHPLFPFVHMPSFCAKKVRRPLLFVMCLIGMVILGTKGTTSFVSKTFGVVLERVNTEVTRCSVGSGATVGMISAFATALLLVNLAAMTGEKEHLQQCQMLYVNLLSIAQRHGLFCASEGQLLDTSLFEATPDLEMKWKVWSRVESAKRLIVGLLLTDSWLSSFFAISPVIVPDSVQIILPCSEALFKANTSTRWMQLIHGGKQILMPIISSPSETVSLPSLDSPVDDFLMQGLLATLQLRNSEAYHRLLSNRSNYPFAPCHTYAMDGRARCLTTLQISIVTNYGDILDRLSPNCIVMWHHMCMSLTADIQIFDLAAGRYGAHPARKALDDIAAWSQTPAARRACLHAAQIFKSLANRKASDAIMFHSVFALFSAALVLGLYTFMVPREMETQAASSSIELLDDIDWKQVGNEGFTSFMEPRGSQPYVYTDDPAANFIRHGGTVYVRGVHHQGGYQSARRLLLDYAGLLKDTGNWSVRKFSYVLHIMSDVLMDVD